MADWQKIGKTKLEVKINRENLPIKLILSKGKSSDHYYFYQIIKSALTVGDGECGVQLHMAVEVVGPKSLTLRLTPPDIRPRIVVILEVQGVDRFGLNKGGTEQEQRDHK